MDINSFQIIFDIILKSIQKRRTTLINQLVRAHDEVLSEIAREGRIVKKKAIIQKNGGVLGAFFSSNVPRFRSVHCRVRYDNYWMTLRQPGNEHLYFESFRMSSTSFQLLCKTLEPLLKPEEITEHVRPPLPIEKQVAVAVYKLASCAEYRVVGDVFGVHKSTVHKYFHRVVEAIVQLKNEFIKFPDLEKCLGVASAFEKTTHIPNIIGAIDGTHIPILPPSEGYLDYINRKGWPSIVMQGVVDNQYMFTDVSVKLPGSSHDATVFKESGLFQRSSELIPQYTKSFNGMEIPLFLVGDPAYPLLPWLLKPFTGCLTPDEESFNCYLSTGRIVIENAFGRLKGRWRCLGKRIDVHPSFVPQVVLACAILHNFVEKQKETYLDAWSYSMEDQLEYRQPRDSTSSEVIADETADPKELRNCIKSYLKNNFPLRKSHI